jgi:hypothetical protein
VAAAGLDLVACGLSAPALTINPIEIVAVAAIAAIRFPNTIRLVSPLGSAFCEFAMANEGCVPQFTYPV